MKHLPLPFRGARAALSLCAVLALAACSSVSPFKPAGEDVLAPNANLFVQGVPPVPMSLVRQVEPYTEIRGHAFVDWHPRQQEMLIAHRAGGEKLTQLYRLSAPKNNQPGVMEKVTSGDEPVGWGSYEPRFGNYLIFSKATGGDEAAKIYRVDLPSKLTTLLTPATESHSVQGWIKPMGQLLYTSVPLDRTAQGGSRAEIATKLWLMDPMKPEGARVLAELPGPGWGVGAVSHDGKQLVIGKSISITESQLWVMDVASGQRRQILPAPGEAIKATHNAIDYTGDGKKLLFTSDRAGEFNELMALDFASGQIERLTSHHPWDVSSATVSDDGQRIAFTINEEGRERIHFLDGSTLKPAGNLAMPMGTVGAMKFHPAFGRLAYGLNSATAPMQVLVADAASGSHAMWTEPHMPPGIDPKAFREPEIVRWNSFDGRSISGLMTRAPAAKFPGKRPVVIMIHGGPEAQAQVRFNGRWNYLTDQLGITLIEPNVRGSSGFGKTFVALDNGFKREDSVKDIGALLDWIATQPDMDASRVMVTGGSYGGYMTLASAVHYSNRLRGAIDVVGISNFVTFLTNTESYRRDLRRVEYGDERDPAMRAFQEKISPANNVEKISIPLFIVQGKNDPRVPASEAEQMVEKLRAAGRPVWYLRAENEGHGFARKENADYQFYATLLFAKQVLLN